MGKQRQANLKKIVIEVRYPPTLSVYANMDRVGIKLKDKFPDWARTSLTLELRNKIQHRRLHIAHRQSVFECDGPPDEVDTEVGIARESIQAVNDALSISTYQRFGMRSCFTSETRIEFPKLVKQVNDRLCVAIEGVDAFAGMALKDVGYTVNLSQGDWTYNVRVGPMEKDQWFSFIRHQAEIFDANQPENSFEAFRDAMPERFLFIDVDAFREDVSVSDAFKVFRATQKKSQEVADKLVMHCLG